MWVVGSRRGQPTTNPQSTTRAPRCCCCCRGVTRMKAREGSKRSAPCCVTSTTSAGAIGVSSSKPAECTTSAFLTPSRCRGERAGGRRSRAASDGRARRNCVVSHPAPPYMQATMRRSRPPRALAARPAASRTHPHYSPSHRYSAAPDTMPTQLSKAPSTPRAAPADDPNTRPRHGTARPRRVAAGAPAANLPSGG